MPVKLARVESRFAHHVGGHHDFFLHHVLKCQQQFAGIYGQYAFDKSAVCVVVAGFVGGYHAAYFGQHGIAAFFGKRSHAAVRYLGGQFLKTGVNKIAIRVVARLNVKSIGNQILR